LPARDIIVIGASAGGVTALQDILQDLPPNFPAAIFIVLHLSPWHKSYLAAVLSRSGPLPASEAQHGEAIERGRVYVAPTNAHLLIQDGHVEVWKGPRENMHRPAINPLFRSAAVAYGPRVAGVILSGSLDDGSAGLWWVKRHGGLAIVQDPSSAEHADMPVNALRYVDADHVAPLNEIPELLKRQVLRHQENAEDQEELMGPEPN
jgi:two-component system chemotaxis response regulator CheB